MNFKLKTLVAAVVLSAAATSANASIDSNNGNSEFVFSAWDSVAGVGYTYDLNWGAFLNDMVGIDQAATAAGNATLLASANVGASMIGANGVIFDDVLTGLPFASAANVQWNFGAFDNVGRTRLLTTKNSLDATPFTPNSNQEKAAVTAFGTYAPFSDGFIAPANSSLADTYAVTAATDGAAYAGNGGAGYYNNLADTTNALGGESFLYLLAGASQNPSLGNGAALQQQLSSFDGKAIVAKTYFSNGQWRLNIATAAVPEADTSAMLLAGLGLMGFIARRRNKAAK